MECINCPYIKEEINNKMNYHGEFSKEFVDELLTSCWCEKVGGKIWWYGRCNDDIINLKKHKVSSNKKRRNKRERYIKYQCHMKKLYEAQQGWYCPVVYTNKIYIRDLGYIENSKPYYKRIYRGSRSSYLKKSSNRKIRRYKGEIQNGFWCHKLYDYWWEMYWYYKRIDTDVLWWVRSARWKLHMHRWPFRLAICKDETNKVISFQGVDISDKNISIYINSKFYLEDRLWRIF